jgi:flavin reductase (DIM6/NTAB) family NADH-FMN oxidoreductase RutF
MLKKIDPKTLTMNPFQAIGEQWMLITAGDEQGCNTMTASWGGVGILWGKPVATAYIRPQRHTKAFVDAQEYFTLSFLPESSREDLVYCGRVSGRDEDKIAHCGLTVEWSDQKAPYFAEAELVLVCRKLFRQRIDPANFLDASIDQQCYPQKDYHDMYIAEIVEAYQK